MKTAARLQSAIEILQSILLDNILPERAFTAWGRSHKFAGSSDRRAIADTVYDVLRHLGTLSYYVSGRNPRLLVAAWIFFIKNQSVQNLFETFSGEKYAPLPLSKEEKFFFLNPKENPTDFESVFNINKSLKGYFTQSFPDNLDAVLGGLSKRAPLDLRVYLDLCDRESVLYKLSQEMVDIKFKICAFAKTGIRTYQNFTVKDMDLFQKGIIDIQDESSQMICQMLAGLAPNRMLDYCAGGGGKSLTFAMHRPNQTEIIASDICETRLKNILERAKRSKIHIRTIAAHRLSPENGLFNMVWVDAPCSGSGTWRRNIYQRMHTISQDIDAYAQKQYDILTKAEKFTDKNGYLVYSTCSLLIQENDMVVKRFLSTYPDYESYDIKNLLQYVPDLTENDMNISDYGINFRPDITKTDGFYCAVMRKK